MEHSAGLGAVSLDEYHGRTLHSKDLKCEGNVNINISSRVNITSSLFNPTPNTTLMLPPFPPPISQLFPLQDLEISIILECEGML